MKSELDPLFGKVIEVTWYTVTHGYKKGLNFQTRLKKNAKFKWNLQILAHKK